MRACKPVLIVLASVLLSPAAAVAGDGDKGFKGVTGHLVVKASPRVCYDAIQSLRKQTPTAVKEISKVEGHTILQETFNNLPFVGKAVCIYEENYVPGKSIEYKMINSDKFKAFEGKWELVGSPDGKETDVRLSSLVLLDLPIPFLRQLTNTQTVKGVRDRLDAVKKMAEANQASLGESTNSASVIQTPKQAVGSVSSSH